MDVSDGFVGDLTKMLAVSGVSARVPIYRLPLSPAARAAIAARPDLFAVAATGGDDYELLAAVAPDAAPAFEAEAAAAGVPVAFVGEAVEGYGPPRFIGPDGGQVTFAARLLQSLLKVWTHPMKDADPMQMRLLAAEAIAREAGAFARRRFRRGPPSRSASRDRRII